jgi:hypothetical protein
MWEPQPLATLRASTACTGITFYLENYDLFEKDSYSSLVTVMNIKVTP